MKYCTRCIYPENHPLNITFDEEGICSGCRIHEEKNTINWKEKGEKLKNILDEYKSKSKSQYDCIIPVSGARDSFFIVHTIKNVYGLKPLLVTYNKQYNTELGIRNLAYLRTIFDCDIMTMTVSPKRVKKITKLTMQKMGSMYWHCLAGQSVFPVQIAVRFKIPLIIWGAHQGVDQVGMFSHQDQVEMTRKYRKEHDLMGFEEKDLKDNFMHVRDEDLYPFLYPHDKEIEKVGIRGIYLNNYIRWDSQQQHQDMISLYGYESLGQNRTFDTYNDVDCFNYSDVHDYIKFLKHGYGKVTDHACREIRLGKLTRKEAIKLVQQYQHRKPNNLQLFLDWLGITESGFYYFINKHRNKKVWKLNEDGSWVLKHSVTSNTSDIENGSNPDKISISKNSTSDPALLTKINQHFHQTTLKKVADDKNYLLFKRGFVDKNPIYDV